MCNLIEDRDSRRARLRLPRTHRWWLALRNRLRGADDGSVARHLVASARGGARIPRRIEQVSLQLPVAATRGRIVQARLTFPARPAKSRLGEVERLVLGIGAQGRNRTTATGILFVATVSDLRYAAQGPARSVYRVIPEPLTCSSGACRDALLPVRVGPSALRFVGSPRSAGV